MKLPLENILRHFATQLGNWSENRSQNYIFYLTYDYFDCFNFKFQFQLTNHQLAYTLYVLIEMATALHVRGGICSSKNPYNVWRLQLAVNHSKCMTFFLFWGKTWEASLNQQRKQILGWVERVWHQDNGSRLWKTTVTASCSGSSHLEMPAPKAGKVRSDEAWLGNRFTPP